MKSSKTSFLRNCISGWNVRRTISSAKTYVRYEEPVRTLIRNNETLIATHV